MLIQQINGLNPQALERCLGDLLDALRTAIETAPSGTSVGIELKAKLGGDDQVPPEMSEKATREEITMDERDGHQRERETMIQHAYREELVERIGRVVCRDGVEEPLPGLHLARSSVSLQPVHSVVEPSICVIAQGSKEVLLGESRYHYDPAHYLLTTVALPRVSQVLSASKEHPYLSLRLELDPSLVSSVAVETDHIWSKQQAAVSAISVSLLG
jgi:hypothetical protein